jgi:hypothetical protein
LFGSFFFLDSSSEISTNRTGEDNMFSIRNRIKEEINTIISPSETIDLILRQSLLSSISPDSVVVTDRRVIIVHQSFWGLYTKFDMISHTEMSIVPFKNVMSVSIVQGKILATVRLRVLGYVEPTRGSTKYEWDIPGLRIYDAVKATNTIGRVVEGRSETQNAKIAPDSSIEYNETHEAHVPYDEKNIHPRDESEMPVAYVVKNNKVIAVEEITTPRKQSKIYGTALGALLIGIGVGGAVASLGFGPLLFLKQAGIGLVDSMFLFIIGAFIIKLA